MNGIMDPVRIPPACIGELREFLYRSGSSFSTADALTAAVKQWIASESAAVLPVRGYQWKQLFLPAGTRVRMQCMEQWFYAEVVQDQLIYRGRPTSPRQLTIAVAGEGRNAWRELWLLRPGEKYWINADTVRRQVMKAPPSAPPSPMEAVQSAAHSMRHALQSALSLVDHVRLSTENAVERRVAKHRRRDDYMIDDCAAD